MCEEPNGCKRKECLPRGGHAEMERKLEGAEQELSVFTPSAVSSRQAPVRKPYHTTPKLVPGFIGRCLRVFQVVECAIPLFVERSRWCWPLWSTGLDGDECDNVDRLFQRRRSLGPAGHVR